MFAKESIRMARSSSNRVTRVDVHVVWLHAPKYLAGNLERARCLTAFPGFAQRNVPLTATVRATGSAAGTVVASSAQALPLQVKSQIYFHKKNVKYTYETNQRVQMLTSTYFHKAAPLVHSIFQIIKLCIQF